DVGDPAGPGEHGRRPQRDQDRRDEHHQGHFGRTLPSSSDTGLWNRGPLVELDASHTLLDLRIGAANGLAWTVTPHTVALPWYATHARAARRLPHRRPSPNYVRPGRSDEICEEFSC